MKELQPEKGPEGEIIEKGSPTRVESPATGRILFRELNPGARVEKDGFAVVQSGGWSGQVVKVIEKRGEKWLVGPADIWEKSYPKEALREYADNELNPVEIELGEAA